MPPISPSHQGFDSNTELPKYSQQELTQQVHHPGTTMKRSVDPLPSCSAPLFPSLLSIFPTLQMTAARPFDGSARQFSWPSIAYASESTTYTLHSRPSSASESPGSCFKAYLPFHKSALLQNLLLESHCTMDTVVFSGRPCYLNFVRAKRKGTV